MARDCRLTSLCSHDACALFDTDSNDFADFALCVSLTGTGRTVEQATMLLYTCRDNSPTRCFDAAVIGCQKVVGNYDPTKGECTGKPALGSLLSVLSRQGPAEGDPYSCLPGGNKTTNHIKSSPGDTGCEATGAAGWDQIASICVAQKDLPLTAKMIDVCSYPSVNPNSDSSDCVVFTSCANLQCPSLGCNQQVCSDLLGRCVPRNGTTICSDSIACTTDICQVFCDNNGCVYNTVPRDSVYGTAIDANGCQYLGKEFQSCLDNSQCPCAGTTCSPSEAAKKRQDIANWCRVTNTTLVDPSIRFGMTMPPPIAPTPAPLADNLLQRPGCTASMLPPTPKPTTTTTAPPTTPIPGATPQPTPQTPPVTPAPAGATPAPRTPAPVGGTPAPAGSTPAPAVAPSPTPVGGSPATTTTTTTAGGGATPTPAPSVCVQCPFGQRCNLAGTSCESIPPCSVAERGKACATPGQVCQGDNGVYACTDNATPACSAAAPNGRCEAANTSCQLDATSNQHLCVGASGTAASCGESNPQGACPAGRECHATASGFQCSVTCSAATCAAPFACEATSGRCLPPGVVPTASCDGVAVGTRTVLSGFQERSCLCAPGSILLCDTDPRACNLISDSAQCNAEADSRCCFNTATGLCLTAAAGASACAASVAPAPTPAPIQTCVFGACTDTTLRCDAASNRCLPADVASGATGKCNGLAVGARTMVNNRFCTCAEGDVLLCFADSNACGLLGAEECALRTTDCCFRTAFGVCVASNGASCDNVNNPSSTSVNNNNNSTTAEQVITTAASKLALGAALAIAIVAAMM